jgi:predicted AAA+ superfamily ATPase
MPSYVPRILDVRKITDRKSCFLFGPRQTGKSSLIAREYAHANVVDLLDDEVYLRLQRRPKDLAGYISNPNEVIVIDEIQRVPNLLNEVHRLIEKRGLRFLLTGSSARKLRRKGVNLLGGRARSRMLHPFVSVELGDAFSLQGAVERGSLPSIHFSSEPWDDLKSYVGDYLKEEIIAEAAVRSVPAFARFLEVAALSNGRMIRYERIANDAQVPRATVQAYYQILRDTLIGRDLPAYRKTKTRKAIQTSRFYFFDLGVVNYLKGLRSIPEHSTDYGFALEALIHHELSSYCDYTGTHEVTWWRSQSGMEVDFLLDAEWAIEVKSSRTIGREDVKGLVALAEDLRLKRKTVVCLEPVHRRAGDVEILPVGEFLGELWK